MGKITKIIQICDCCKKELVGRLTYRTCPCCGKDVCLACISKEDARHKPKEKKVKAEQVLTPPVPSLSTAPVEQASTPSTAPTKKRTKKPTLADLKIKIDKDGTPYQFEIGGEGYTPARILEGALWAVKELGLTDSADPAVIIAALKEQPESSARTELIKIFEGVGG